MKMILFFDLPVETAKNRREYSKFRKFLIKNGFVMIQKSVYCKTLLNQSNISGLTISIKKNKPETGKIQLLTVTERQYEKIEYILGEYDGDIINSDERFLII